MVYACKRWVFLDVGALRYSWEAKAWEMKGSEYAKTLAKVQVRAIFHSRDIRNEKWWKAD